MASHFRRCQMARTRSMPAPLAASSGGTLAQPVGPAVPQFASLMPVRVRPLQADAGVLDLVEEGPVADVEQLGRAQAVPPGVLEHLEDGGPLRVLGGAPAD